jgi:Holliday junction resolvase-like predicted endonuclease
MILTVAGLSAQSEFATSHGRIDIVIDLPQITYIVEVKLNASAAQALAQIQERKYYERFLAHKSVMLLGLSFTRASQAFEIEYTAQEL